MARQKKEDPPKGAPAWQSTFSDLMNLLLCFFVLLFSMSTVDAKKYEVVVQSFKQAFSVLPSGGTTIGKEGTLISTGVSALKEFDNYFNASTANEGDTKNENNEDTGNENSGNKNNSDNKEESSNNDKDTSEKEVTEEEAKEKYQAEEMSQSEKMAEEIEQKAAEYGLSDILDVDYNGQYVKLTLNGAILFDSGKSDFVSEAQPVLDKISAIIEGYPTNLIEIEGHTDNVPIHSKKYESNDVLSMYRALSVANYIRSKTTINPGNIISSGRGEYDPIADNSTPEGRSLNRRVVIKIYNDLNSQDVNKQ
jgi:chemotaxis protein MotB